MVLENVKSILEKVGMEETLFDMFYYHLLSINYWLVVEVGSKIIAVQV